MTMKMAITTKGRTKMIRAVAPPPPSVAVATDYGPSAPMGTTLTPSGLRYA